MHFYTMKSSEKRKSVMQWTLKFIETSRKCLAILSGALIPTWLVVEFWYHVFHLHHWYVSKEVREVLMTAVIPILGLTYALLTAKLIDKVFDEYKDMRIAVKRRDIERFMQLMDEDLSPLLHGMATILAFAVLGGLMMLEYADFWEGALVIGTTSYIFTLLCITVIEVDDPCHGFWIIKSIPEEWMLQDPKKWRSEHYTLEVTVTKKVELTTTDTKAAA
jgi:hypothetical protein